MKYKRNQSNLAKQKFEKTTESKELQEFEERHQQSHGNSDFDSFNTFYHLSKEWGFTVDPKLRRQILRAPLLELLVFAPICIPT